MATRRVQSADVITPNPLSLAAQGATQDENGHWQMPVGPSLIPTQEEEPEMTASDRVALMLNDAALDDRAYLQVYKLNEEKQFAFCEKMTPMSFEAGGYDMIRRRFGAGTYQIRLYGTNPGSNRFTIRARENIEIIPVREEALQSHSNGDGNVAAILQAMQEQNRMVLEAIQNRPVVDPMANFKETLTLVTLMREAFGMSNQAPQKSSISEIVDAIKELKGAKSLIDGDEDKEPSVLQLGSQVLELVTKSQQNPPVQAAVQIPSSIAQASRPPVSLQSNPVPEMQADQSQEITEEQVFIFQMKQLLKSVVEMAVNKTDPSEAAEMLYENLPDQIINMIDDPKGPELLKQFAPELNAHEEWVKKVHGELVEIIKEEGQESPSDERTGNGEHDNGVSPNGH